MHGKGLYLNKTSGFDLDASTLMQKEECGLTGVKHKDTLRFKVHFLFAFGGK